ncbi:MAG: LuxR C-terminal-related transcriptional regulator, partial [Clostridiales bacterium]|nr:LuxR C-terminal-related transcriptional regulator [Clostridiales bacterium]
MLNYTNKKSLNDLLIAARFMPRPRIDDILDQATRYGLVYVIAGMGYGKTQAVRHYIERQPEAAVRWIQLSESSNIASRYWEAFTYNVSLDNLELAEKLRELGFPNTLARFKQFAAITKALEHRSRKPFLVFDDCHLISSEKVLKFMERCAHLHIAGSCMILISRKEPRINAVSLFVKKKACMITEEALRFTGDETSAFLTCAGATFSPKSLPEISVVTKGWALAIQLLFLVLKRIPSDLSFALNAMKQSVFKLIETEAFEEFPKEAQKILVRFALVSDLPFTSLREFFDDFLFLRDIPQLTAFVWFDSFTGDYRIQPLYLEFLQSRRYILTWEEKQDTYQKAAQWCFEHDFHAGAVYYFAELRQFKRVLEIFLSYPYRLAKDMSEYFVNILEKLEPNPQESESFELSILKNIFIPLLLAGQGQYNEAKDRAFAVIEEWAHKDIPLAPILLYSSYNNLAYIDTYLCVVTHKYNAPQYLKKGAEYFKLISPPPKKIAGPFNCADIRSFACLVGEGAARADFDRFLESTQQIAPIFPKTHFDLYCKYEDLAACELAFFKGQLDLARRYACQTIPEAHEKKQYSIESMALLYLLRVSMQEGDFPSTKEILKQLRGQLDYPDFWNRQLFYDLFVGYFYAQIGIPELVPSWFILDEKEVASDIHIPNIELFICVKCCMALKKYKQALAILCNSSSREAHERFLFGELTFSLLTAVARLKTGDGAGAITEFERAYQLSFDGEFETPFVELGKDLQLLADLVLKQADGNISREWLKTVVLKASAYRKKIQCILEAFRKEKNMEEPVELSEREHQILHDLYLGLSREEIAASRYLSINTVKTALHSLYNKLNANNNAS